jgi:hypothetical protein
LKNIVKKYSYSTSGGWSRKSQKADRKNHEEEVGLAWLVQKTELRFEEMITAIIKKRRLASLG